MAINFTVSPSSATGNVFLTEFTFTVPITGYTSFAWDFGDNIVSYTGPSTSHIYKYPGTYTVSGSAWTDDGTTAVFSTSSISVNYVYPNKIIFSQIPTEFSNPGQKTKTPFVISLTSTEIERTIGLVLQSLNTDSIPIVNIPAKWQAIVPKWQFINADTNELITETLIAKTTPIYQTQNNVQRIVAVSGTASFYYLDDISTRYDNSTSSPILLIASLSTNVFVYPPDSPVYSYNSYSNDDAARAAVVWQVNNCFPTNLKITENFISDIYPIKWKNVSIPTMITCEFNSGLNSNYTNATPVVADILGYPRTNDIGSKFPIKIGLTDFQTYTTESSAVYFQNVDNSQNKNSGYVYTSIKPTSTSTSTINVIASTICTEPYALSSTSNFVFPNGYPIYSSGYVYRPYESNVNSVNLVNYPATNEYINYYKKLGTLTDCQITLLSTSASTFKETLTTQLSSGAATYGASFDPILNTLYAWDPKNQSISIFNNKNQTTATVSLPYALLNYNLGINPINPCNLSLDKNHNAWISLYNNKTILKLDQNLSFLLTTKSSMLSSKAGEALVAPPMVETDSSNNVWASFATLSSSYVSKFNLSGVEIFAVSLSALSSVPVSLAVDKNDNVWVACYNSNIVQQISSNGTLGYRLSAGFSRPNHLAIDRSNNVWFTNGYHIVSKFNQNTTSLSTWQISSIDTVSIPVTSFETYDVWQSSNSNGITGHVWSEVIYGNGTFVAITSGNDNAALYSADGITWNQTTVPLSANWTAATYGNNKFVALQNKTNTALISAVYSTDGINWNTTPVLSGNWTSVVYGTDKFVAVQNSTSATTLLYSTDGVTWLSSSTMPSAQWTSVTYGNGRFVAVANGTTGAYSTNGINWTTFSLTNLNWTSVTYGNGRFVAVANGTTGAYSDNGSSWITFTLTNKSWSNVTYGNGMYIAVATDNTVAYSLDGTIWIYSTLPVSASWNSIVYGNRRFVAAAQNNLIRVITGHETWGGLAIDVYDRVWLLDSRNNKIVVFSTQDPINLRCMNSQPSVSSVSINSLYFESTGQIINTNTPTSRTLSLQSVGDWTGNRWYQKYANAIYSTPVSGTSAPFTVYDLDTSYNVTKVNEEFDVSAYFKSLALPESLSQNTLFFDEFLAAVVGDGNPTTESAGRVIYERIANFVQTHGNFETAEINQLLSYAEQMSVSAKTFGIEFPTEINRLLNLFSIPKNQLRGRISYDPDSTNNIGPIIEQTDTIQAGQYLYIRDRNYDNYQLIYVAPLADGTTSYPLSALTVEGFKTPIQDFYYIFQYNPTTTGYVDNIINWDSLYTTFDYTLSTNEEWYGDNGLIETMFNKILTKRLII